MELFSFLSCSGRSLDLGHRLVRIADTDKDEKLNQREHALAMHVAAAVVQFQQPLPAALPAELLLFVPEPVSRPPAPSGPPMRISMHAGDPTASRRAEGSAGGATAPSAALVLHPALSVPFPLANPSHTKYRRY